MRAEAASVEFRLRSAQGHIEGVIRMVEEDRYCIEVLQQLAAVDGAIQRARREILESHLRGCVPEAMAAGRIDQAVDELVGAALGFSTRHHGADGAHRCHHQPASIAGGDE
ncbi:MAG: metal-sensitive transcriptional regulator [Acidimicrobiia bacterium]|nr:metal-sensitive transcriptional regulator [Acidimicrobiia bacterium]